MKQILHKLIYINCNTLFERRADTGNKLEGEPDVGGSHSCLWNIPRRGPAQPLSPDRKTTGN